MLVGFLETKQNSQKKRTGLSGIFAACLELTREGIISIKQNKTFDFGAV